MRGWNWGGIVAFLVVQISACILRCYSRIFLVHKFGWDDTAVLLTLIASTGYDVCLLIISAWTNNENVAHISPERIIPSTRVLFASELFYIFGAAVLKVALALTLLRVLIARWQRWTIYLTVVICILYGIFYFFLTLFQCGNPHNFATKILTGTCQPNSTVAGAGYTHAAINCIADWISGLMPIALLWNSGMNRRAKLSVAVILGIGSLGSIATIVRIAWFHELLNLTPNFFHDAQGIGIMSAAELSIGILCVCLPTYRPFFRGGYFDRSGANYYYYGSSNNLTDRDTMRSTHRSSSIPELQNTFPMANRQPQDPAEEDEEEEEEADEIKEQPKTSEVSVAFSPPTDPSPWAGEKRGPGEGWRKLAAQHRNDHET